MLDPTTYRLYEELARNRLPSWRLAQRHNLDVFEKIGFPVRLRALPQLRQLLDTMQEGRFEAFQEETGGFTEAELEDFLELCGDAVAFQRNLFPHEAPIVPLDTLISAYVVYRKVRALKGGFPSLLELGPGSGSFSFCLSRLHPELELYVQAEACESFYILQHWTNLALFGPLFCQTLYQADGPSTPFAGEWMGWDGRIFGTHDNRSCVSELRLPEAPRLVVQYPWWNLGELARSERRFDVVMSNANLLEFSTEALEDYLLLVRGKMKPDGIFFVQCFGGSSDGRDIPYALQRLRAFGFAPLFLAYHGTPKGDPVWAASQESPGLGASDPRSFFLSNAVFVHEGHPWFPVASAPGTFRNGMHVPMPELRRAFFPDLAGRKRYGREDVVALLEARFLPKERPSGPAD